VNDPQRSTIGMRLRERLAAYEEATDFNDRPAAADPAVGLVSLGFIWGALRRGARVWVTLALIGLVIGGGYYVGSPPPPKATTSVLLVNDPAQDPVGASQTDIALAQSIPVAAAVIQQLGLQQTPSSFIGTYTLTALTNQVLLIIATGTSSNDAVQRVSAIAAQFLKFRAQYVQSQQQQTDAQLGQQVNQAQANLDSITGQISQLSSQPTFAGQQAKLSKLQAQRTAATNALAQVQQYATGTRATTRTVAQSMIRGSEVLNAAAPAKKSSLAKGAATYAIGGLIAGLALGIAIIIIGAIASDRLRRRDDIAYAFGAPVRLSVGPLRKSRLPDLGRQAERRRRDMDRLVEHLRHAVPGSSNGPAGLAVIAVDDTPTVAQAVIGLADSIAKRGRVVLADLSAGTHSARILGVEKPGVTMVDRPDNVRIAVVVPAAGDIAPVGSLRGHVSPTYVYAQPDEAIASTSAHADLVLSLVTLDPAIGGEHIATWATDVVAVVTAGRATATRIHATGEMVRLAGARLSSVVVVGVDKTDESLGISSTEHVSVG
jgi:hypothetical protein